MMEPSLTSAHSLFLAPETVSSAKFSPFSPDKVLLATSKHFGVVGPGSLMLIQSAGNGVFTPSCQFPLPCGANDCCFSELNESILLAGCADGGLYFFDLTKVDQKPMMFPKVHDGDVYSCEWNHINKGIFASSGNDACVKVGDFTKSATSLALKGHTGPIHQIAWHPTHPHIIASASGDRTIRIWDLRKSLPVKTINAHLQDVLTLDFNKYENALASGGGDGLVKIWDLRSDKDMPLRYFTGHSYATKRVKFSPFNKNILASAGLYFFFTLC